jgi:hypothetical protein
LGIDRNRFAKISDHAIEVLLGVRKRSAAEPSGRAAKVIKGADKLRKSVDKRAELG